MDTFDSRRSTVPARMAAQRPLAPATIRPSAGLPEAAHASPISLRVAIRGARRYWWLVLMLWTVGSAGVGAGVYLKVRPSYRASSYLRVDPSATQIFEQRANGDQLEPYLQTQVQLITSPNVLTAAGTDPKAAVLPRIQTAGDVVIELRKVITVTVVQGTFLIEVAMTSPSAYESATLVNAVVQAFIDANVEWSDGMTRSQIKNLETYMGELKNQSDEHERRWKELVARGHNESQVFVKQKQVDGTVQAENQGAKRSSITLEQYKRVQQGLFEVNIELAQADALLSAIKNSAQVTEKDPTLAMDETLVRRQIDRQFRTDPEVMQLAPALTGARSKLAGILGTVRDQSDPAARQARDKLAGLEKQYKQMYEAKGRQIREQIETGGPAADPGRELREAETKVASLKVRQVALKDELGQLEVHDRQGATDEVEIALIRDQRESLKSMQETVNRRLEQLKFESKGEARIRPVNAAVPPGRPISDNRMKYLAMTPVGVLGTVLGLIVLLEIRSARVGDPDQLSSRVRHEVFSIAPLPNIRPGDDANDDKAEQRLARFVQSLDHLRVALCEGGQPGEGRCVMITSATGGEGKTTLSAHLAARCANAGTSTLLIDADMRRASLGRLLDVPVGPGLGDVLAGDLDLDEATITVQAGGFHFLSAGTPGRDPSQVLKSSRLSELLGRLRQTYDLVIIDTPPVLPVADALILGRYADGAVMAARFDASRLPLVERANRQLAAAGIPVLGVVVNGVKGRDASYGNYAYSYNYPGRSERSAEAPTV